MSQQQPHYVHRVQYTTQERIVGVFVLIGLAVVIGLMVAKGQSTNFFEERITYHATLDNAQGVSTETPVKVSGIEVGRVSSLGISEQNRVDVEFFVYERFRDLIREDSQGALGKLSMLGNATLNITTGSPEREPLPEDAEIPVEEPQSINDLIAAARPVVERMRNAIEDATRLIAAVDPDAVSQATDNLAQAAANARRVTDDVRAGKGPVGEILYGETTQARVERTTAAMAETAELAEARMRELEPVTTDAEATMAAFRELAERLPALSDDVDALVAGFDRTATLANERLEDLPELTTEAEVLLGEANRTMKGAQRIWPLSEALEGDTGTTVIEAQPAQQ